jgi:hypothetical protein
MSRRVSCASSRDNKGFLLDQEGLSSSRGVCGEEIQNSNGKRKMEDLFRDFRYVPRSRADLWGEDIHTNVFATREG